MFLQFLHCTGDEKGLSFSRKKEKKKPKTLAKLNIQSRCVAWHLSFERYFLFCLFSWSSCRDLLFFFFLASLIQRNLPRLSIFRHGGWSSAILEALGSAVISWLSEHNGWKLSYYLSVLSKGKGSCGAERPRKTLALILRKGVGQPSWILFSYHAM